MERINLYKDGDGLYFNEDRSYPLSGASIKGEKEPHVELCLYGLHKIDGRKFSIYLEIE